MKNLLKNKGFMVKAAMLTVALLMVVSPDNAVFATSGGAAGMDKFDNLIKVIATWLGRIGLVVAFFGAVQTALGFKNDDADGKIRGLKTLASGFLVFGITQSLSLFGL